MELWSLVLYHLYPLDSTPWPPSSGRISYPRAIGQLTWQRLRYKKDIFLEKNCQPNCVWPLEELHAWFITVSFTYLYQRNSRFSIFLSVSAAWTNNSNYQLSDSKTRKSSSFLLIIGHRYESKMPPNNWSQYASSLKKLIKTPP